MKDPDTRVNAWRPDLADIRLRGTVRADRFVAGKRRQNTAGSLSLRKAPQPEARQVSELLHGEIVQVFEIRDGWAWIQSEDDLYVGYAAADRLSEEIHPPTHRVKALRSFVYPEPDLKSPALDLLSMNAWVTVTGQDGRFSRLAGGNWMWSGHLATPGDVELDHAAVAMRFMGTPYLWGGRTSIGLDCSGLAQMALARCGRPAPRDSDMQQATLGVPVAFDGDESVLNRGDLVFWPGHVGIWLSPDLFVHANGSDMMVSAGPLRDIARRIEKETGDPIAAIRRI